MNEQILRGFQVHIPDLSPLKGEKDTWKGSCPFCRGEIFVAIINIGEGTQGLAYSCLTCGEDGTLADLEKAMERVRYEKNLDAIEAELESSPQMEGIGEDPGQEENHKEDGKSSVGQSSSQSRVRDGQDLSSSSQKSDVSGKSQTSQGPTSGENGRGLTTLQKGDNQIRHIKNDGEQSKMNVRIRLQFKAFVTVLFGYELTGRETNTLLFLFAYPDKGYTAAEIARRIRIPATNIYRLLSSLEREGLIVSTKGEISKDPQTYKISEGLKKEVDEWIKKAYQRSLKEG